MKVDRRERIASILGPVLIVVFALLFFVSFAAGTVGAP